MGRAAVWWGRLVPEKAPHHAIDAARAAGLPIVLAGPIHDAEYFERQVRPRLGRDVEYVGHLRQHELNELVGGAAVAVVTPQWDEPYGLVAAEAMACGTPVAAFARGALPEIVDDSTGSLAAPGDLDALANAMQRAAALDRGEVRRTAEARFAKARMVDDYERLYLSVAPGGLGTAA